MVRPRPSLSAGMHWVQPEFARNLSRTRTVVERFAEDGASIGSLQEGITALREVAGTARVVQCSGVTIAAMHTCEALEALAQQTVDDVNACASAIMSALVQLEDYCDALASGYADQPVALHPVLNEVRLSRGLPVLSEAELFAAQLVETGTTLAFAGAREGAPSAPALATRYEALFQQSLVAWLRQEAPQGIARIGKLAEAMANGATDAEGHMLWRCLAAVAEAALRAPFPASTDFKRLLGRTGAAVRAQADGKPITDARQLSGSLLLYLGRSERPGPRGQALIDELSLAQLLPDEESLSHLRGRLRGANTALINRLSQELRSDLQTVKSHIDLHLRAGAGDAQAARGLLDQMAHTLAMLGLPALARMARNQMSLLTTLLEEEADATHEGWLDIAAALLRVEVSLDEALQRQLAPPRSVDDDTPPLGEEIPNIADLQSGERALLRESQINLGRLKAAVDAWVRTQSLEGLDQAPRQIGEVGAALRLLNEDHTADLLTTLAGAVERHGLTALCATDERAESFADAIAATEFILESLLQRRPAEAHLRETLAERLAMLVPDDAAEGLDAETAGVELSAHGVDDASAPVVPESDTAAAADTVDPDIREVFIEEAAEVQETLQRAFASWQRDPGNSEAMLEVRRGFHTLKGSGRMVQADAVGEFAWNCEQLLNACRDGGLTVSPQIVGFIEEAIAFTPHLVTSWADGAPLDKERLDTLSAEAQALLRNEDADDSGQELRDVFNEDAAAQLGLVSRWLSAPDREAEAVPPDVIRAFHTLRGASAAVGFDAFSAAVTCAERYLNALRRVGRVPDQEGAAVLRDLVDALRAAVESGNTDPTAEQLQDWQQRFDALHSSLPALAGEGDDGHSQRDAACLKLLDGLDAVESALRAGGQAADDDVAETNQAVAARLEAVAAIAEAELPAKDAVALSAPSRALAQALTDGARPDAEALAAVIEGLYQQLDAVRDGTVPSSEPLLQSIAQFVSGVDAAATAPDATSPPGNVTALDAAGDDAELRDIFVSEAQELLESIDSSLDQFERNPGDASVAQDLSRQLHTLKGSARVAGFTDIGEVAHHCETIVGEIETDASSVGPATLARLHNACDGMFRALDRLRAGQAPQLAALLEDLAGDVTQPAPAQVAAPDAVAQDAPPGDATDSDDNLHAIDFTLPDEQDTPVGRAAPPEAVDFGLPESRLGAEEIEAFAPLGDEAPQPADEDVSEVHAVFQEEAADLLETLERTLARWEQDVSDGVSAAESGALTDLRRALHTLKGSARMAGLGSIGTAAHEMESLVEDIIHGALDADSGSFLQLRTRLEQLQHLHAAMNEAPLADRGAGTSGETDQEATFFDSSDIDQLGYEAAPAASPRPADSAVSQWDPRVLWQPEVDDDSQLGLRRELARVPVPTLEGLLNQAGEVSVLRARLDQQANGIGTQIAELNETVLRLRDQLRQLNSETEAQIAARGLRSDAADADQYEQDFDPLEMDRYTRMQELSRALAESVGDLEALQGALRAQLGESEALLLQQQRINSDLQQGLMGTLMVPFARQVQRLQRVLRQSSQETGKQLRWHFSGEEIEVDRNVLERMTAPLEHALRNAVVHGIEDADSRIAAGKSQQGSVDVTLEREGQQLKLTISDDGRGLDYAAIRDTAIARSLMHADADLSQAQLALFILEPGFSTAQKLTQSAGRGVGMDVLAAEVRQLGGTLDIESAPGKGTRFIIHLPITLGLTQALMFVAGDANFAVSLSGVRGIARVPRAAAEDGASFEYGDDTYRVAYAADYLDVPRGGETQARAVPAILLRLPEGVGEGTRHVAMVVDRVVGNREVVSKTIGPTVASVPGMTGATILPDGSVVLLLDLVALVSDRIRRRRIAEVPPARAVAAEARPLVMVVDDSITMRRVAERLLSRNGFEVMLARDGVDAMGQLATARPEVVLLDIEMPRADGFEVATYMRNSEALRDTPIIMITSRSGDKHRERAARIGVQRYLIKPYQEKELLETIRELRSERQA